MVTHKEMVEYLMEHLRKNRHVKTLHETRDGISATLRGGSVMYVEIDYDRSDDPEWND